MMRGRSLWSLRMIAESSAKAKTIPSFPSSSCRRRRRRSATTAKRSGERGQPYLMPTLASKGSFRRRPMNCLLSK
eukprot:14513547-Alexandrium_andersonii.AAC.1